MTSNKGISAETFEKVRFAIEGCDLMDDDIYVNETQAAITALLASGEVVLRKDVEELVGTLQWVHEAVRNSNMEMIRKHNVERHIKQALAKFTTKPKEGM